MTAEDLHGCLTFLRAAERLKDVRSAYTCTSKQESTAAHS